ncbi:hypothetical protein ABZ419_09770 [Streptomyces cinnamoneus]|uniref:VG15 protein n=1 Tax=Streptomyces cinnamoneus TaxID=53446 RepID=UPI0033C5F1E4
MTSAARQAEADQVSAAFHVALTQIGARTTAEALALWAEVPTGQRAAAAAGWLRQAITLVMSRRRMSRDLARAYYRLARALHTGRTTADPYHPEPAYITLDSLRREFAALAGLSEPTPPEKPALQPRGSEEEPLVDKDAQAATGADKSGDQEHEDADRILVEEIARLREEEERIEREAEEELRAALDALGTRNLDRRLSQIDDQQPARDADEARQEAHRQAGAQQAASASRIAMNGGRSTIWHHTQRDRRALGYVRVSRTGTPCGFCAMLISRGVSYKSEASATYKDGDLFHDRCHCYAEPVFSRQQFGSSELFALNRQYEALWPEVTKGHTGRDALNAWRRFIRRKQRELHKAAAQEARQSATTTQEA